MILEIIVLLSIVIVFVIFARHLPEIKIKAKDVKFNTSTSSKDDSQENDVSTNQKKSFWDKDNNGIENELSEADKLLKSQKIQEAEKLYLSLATKNPSNPKVYNRLGALYLEQGSYEDAKEAFRETIKFDQKVGSRWYNLALAQIGLKEYRSAINSLVKAVKIEKKNKKYLEALKDVRKRLKKIKPIKS